ncbi:MAG: hypothetical protein IJK14_05650, partial [Clostridia bacterium]|nr:hypothetical protein [Clostridia bacterium]
FVSPFTGSFVSVLVRSSPVVPVLSPSAAEGEQEAAKRKEIQNKAAAKMRSTFEWRFLFIMMILL